MNNCVLTRQLPVSRGQLCSGHEHEGPRASLVLTTEGSCTDSKQKNPNHCCFTEDRNCPLTSKTTKEKMVLWGEAEGPGSPLQPGGKAWMGPLSPFWTKHLGSRGGRCVMSTSASARRDEGCTVTREPAGPRVRHTFPSLADGPQASLPIHAQKSVRLHRATGPLWLRSGCTNHDQSSCSGHSCGSTAAAPR